MSIENVKGLCDEFASAVGSGNWERAVEITKAAAERDRAATYWKQYAISYTKICEKFKSLAQQGKWTALEASIEDFAKFKNPDQMQELESKHIYREFELLEQRFEYLF